MVVNRAGAPGEARTHMMHVEPSFVLHALLLDPRCCLRAHTVLNGPVEPVKKTKENDAGQMQIHLSPPVPDKLVDDTFERFRGWLVHCLCARWQATTVVQRRWKPPKERHWSQTVWQAQLGGTQARRRRLSSITASYFETTQQRFILCGRADVMAGAGAPKSRGSHLD